MVEFYGLEKVQSQEFPTEKLYKDLEVQNKSLLLSATAISYGNYGISDDS